VARDDPKLVPVLPDLIIRRAYWSSYHETARDLMRVRTVADFLKELVGEESGIFVRM
jgi:hypothetical protein